MFLCAQTAGGLAEEQHISIPQHAWGALGHPIQPWPSHWEPSTAVGLAGMRPPGRGERGSAWPGLAAGSGHHAVVAGIGTHHRVMA